MRACPAPHCCFSALAAMTLLLIVLSLADATHVTSKKSWAAGNEYLVEADVDGRTRPQSEPCAEDRLVEEGPERRLTN